MGCLHWTINACHAPTLRCDVENILWNDVERIRLPHHSGVTHWREYIRLKRLQERAV